MEILAKTTAVIGSFSEAEFDSAQTMGSSVQPFGEGCGTVVSYAIITARQQTSSLYLCVLAVAVVLRLTDDAGWNSNRRVFIVLPPRHAASLTSLRGSTSFRQMARDHHHARSSKLCHCFGQKLHVTSAGQSEQRNYR